MKFIITSIALFFIAVASHSQEIKKISRDWTSFSQSINISTDSPRKFILKGSIRVIPKDSMSGAGLWARVDRSDEERGFFDNMSDRLVQSSEWKEYTIEGSFNKNAKKLVFGGLVHNDGEFFYDNISLQIEDEEGEMKLVTLGNPSFESPLKNGIIKDWSPGISKNKTVLVNEYKMSSSKNAVDGSFSLLIKGEGTEPGYSPTRIGEIEGYTPQVGALITMLDDLKSRVKDRVKNLSQYEVDHLHDEEANRIGALIMHLASAEVIYQNLTFEGREFNEEEKEKWEPALDLGKKGRDTFKGKPISYYLKEYDKVRARTKELFKTVDDEWLMQEIPAGGITNFFSWFHVMEHQSSHLGQILFLAKRIPPEAEILAPEEIKN
ncbi:DinB family protein [Dokdonia sp. Hel_I_53]|uniref:DinB family protein n=1 Tax=Dokdonia sp. Hel_I_53 TaxID=1566287 RepID=UPI00119B8F97|nr:DinB family protein [Dokdonia sp. Hel_I_53]TVZ51948.1 uncharacterized protein DUF664 [Dokdonia sp. Hel_I_53]